MACDSTHAPALSQAGDRTRLRNQQTGRSRTDAFFLSRSKRLVSAARPVLCALGARAASRRERAAPLWGEPPVIGTHLVRLIHLALPAGLAADVARDGGPVAAVPCLLELEQLGRAPRHSHVTWLLHAPRGDLFFNFAFALLFGLAADVARDGGPVETVPVNRCLELDQLGLAP
jgi:hypothetical protein